jgi:hypothetical protein
MTDASLWHPWLRMICSQSLDGWGRELEAGRYDPTVGVVTKLARVLRVRVTELLE